MSIRVKSAWHIGVAVLSLCLSGGAMAARCAATVTLDGVTVCVSWEDLMDCGISAGNCVPETPGVLGGGGGGDGTNTGPDAGGGGGGNTPKVAEMDCDQLLAEYNKEFASGYKLQEASKRLNADVAELEPTVAKSIQVLADTQKVKEDVHQTWSTLEDQRVQKCVESAPAKRDGPEKLKCPLESAAEKAAEAQYYNVSAAITNLAQTNQTILGVLTHDKVLITKYDRSLDSYMKALEILSNARTAKKCSG